MKKQEMQNNKGITLIALVITIIVMLILVTVTITMAVNGGLFEYAGKATGDTRNVINAEKELANLDTNMTIDELIEKYTTEETSKFITFYLNGVEFTVNEGTRWMDWLKSVDASELNEKGITNFNETVRGNFTENQRIWVDLGSPLYMSGGIRDPRTDEYGVIAGELIEDGVDYVYKDMMTS